MRHASHISVLLAEAVDALALSPDSVVIDATLGAGGHASLILEKLGAGGKLLGIDADAAAIAAFRARLSEGTHDAAVELAVGNFRNIVAIAAANGIHHADAILADFGWRMEQFVGTKAEGGGKGFSFTTDEPLLMTYGDPETYPFVARDIINDWREEDIANVLKGYGEERYARRIARAIVGARERALIETAAALADVVSAAVPGAYRHSRIHPATKTFQALRIAVNDELDAIRAFMEDARSLLTEHGRLAIITFHSIEDRIVKHTIRAFEHNGQVRRITKKPIVPTDEEIARNPRARSAKLRILETL